MTERLSAWPWWLTAALALAAAPPALGQDSTASRPPAGSPAGPGATVSDSSIRTASVSYVTGNAVYIAAGRDDGLVEGSELMIVRGDSVVGRLKVQYISSRQSSCVVVEGAVNLKVGDLVRYIATGLTERKSNSPPSQGSSSRQPPSRSLTGSGLHGRIGTRYLSVSAAGSGYGQPSADLSLSGTDLGGSGLGIAVDLRARRTTSTINSGPDRVDGRARFYEANASWHTASSAVRIVVGRQYSASLSALSLFDGLLVELVRPNWGVGLFGGAQPDPDLGFSADVKETGGFIGVHSRPGTGSQWALTSGVIGSFVHGKANREFAYLQGVYSGPVVSVFASQELDYYTPWKVAAGESSLSPTSTYINANVRITRELSFFGGYDTRRNVRLYRDVVDPLTEFDDAYRNGVSAGLAYTAARWRIGADARSSSGGPEGRASSYTGNVGISGIARLLSADARVSRYDTPSLSGWLYALRSGIELSTAVHLELNGGLRTQTDPLADPASTSISWYGADLDLALGRSWFVLLSVNRENQPDGATNQFYGALTWRF